MNSVAPYQYQSLNNSNPSRAELMHLAERELSAFFNTVTELFGSEQAELSAKDWRQELEVTNCLPASVREWRLFTTKIATRLASRVAPVLVS